MQIGWIDYSDSAKQITLQILDALKERRAIDELGIGIVRDALADKLFPATSTLLTRAKYFFLIPYALRDLERSHESSKTARQLQLEYNDTEKELAKRLLTMSDSREGIFGNRSLRADLSGPWVKRGPGVVYWTSLRTLGIMKDPHMRYAEYFSMVRRMASSDSHAPHVAKDDDIGLVDDIAARASYWNIPNSEYQDWENRLGIELTQGEAVFLKGCIIERCPNTLYSLMASNPDIRAIANAVGDQYTAELANGVVINPYHLFVREADDLLPPEIAGICNLGIDFSNFVYGCRIRYNAQIPAQAEQAESLWSDYAHNMREYAEALDIDLLYGTLGIARHVGAGNLFAFLKEARDCMLSHDVVRLDDAVKKREIALKHGRAKIGRESQGNEAWVGGAQLSYRYDVGLRMIGEIEVAGGFDA